MRHPLLYYQRLGEQYFWPAVLIVALSATFLYWNPDQLRPYRSLLTLSFACCTLVLILTFVYRLRAYAVCSGEGLRVQFPFYHIAINYADIKNVRPTELFRMYPAHKQRWLQRRFIGPLLGATVIVIELDQLPSRKGWLRLWMSKYMLAPDRVGLIIAVRDWLSFRSELDEFRARQKRPRY